MGSALRYWYSLSQSPFRSSCRAACCSWLPFQEAAFPLFPEFRINQRFLRYVPGSRAGSIGKKKGTANRITPNPFCALMPGVDMPGMGIFMPANMLSVRQPSTTSRTKTERFFRKTEQGSSLFWRGRNSTIIYRRKKVSRKDSSCMKIMEKS